MTARVLFVGNSYTFGHDMPGQVAALAASDPRAIAIETERVVEGGASLSFHWSESGARARIDEATWTHVVLQEKSTGPLHDTAAFHQHAGDLGRLARAAGARVLLFETWARRTGHEAYRWEWSGKSPREMQRRLRTEYAKAAAALGAELVPVGDAWERALSQHPLLVLHDVDLHHASALGAHLTAAVFFAWLTRVDPTETSFCPAELDENDARLVRAAAWETVAPRLPSLPSR